MTEKIQKILSEYGICSRRKGELLVAQGAVLINGITAQVGQKADPTIDEILINGSPLPSKPEFKYVMLNKPKGYVVTLSDEKGRKNVTELITDINTRLYPVGRLDLNSEGLLILTNDGEFSNKLMHPSSIIEKEYLTWIITDNLEKTKSMLSNPMEIDNYTVQPALVKVMSNSGNRALLSITIHEGRNRQVRKMCEKAGAKVTRLKRIREGNLQLGDLKPGSYRPLTAKEITYIKSIK